MARTPVIALVSCASARTKDLDLQRVADGLQRAGREVSIEDWDDAAVDWTQFAAAIVRSPWDYHVRYDEFMRWVRRVSSQTLLMNPADVIAWNTDKIYLEELIAAGLPVVPTMFVPIGSPTPELPDDIVVKPTISAGSNNTARFVNDDAGARAHIASLHAMGKTAMVQPYQSAIDDEGETGLLYFNGKYSHAFRKAAIFSGVGHDRNDLYVVEKIDVRDATPEQRTVGDAVMAFITRKFTEAPLYVRVDLVPGDNGQSLVIEIEMTEPSLFLHTAEGSADRFAAAVCQRLQG